MSDPLIRNLEPDGKRALKARAARNGRFQQADVRAILEELRPESKSWVALLHSASQSVGDIELEQPERHSARE